jgi:hypothetical protein
MQAIHRLLSVPRELRDTNWLFDSLQLGLEIEFSTVPLYLYAMWSLDDTSLAGVPGAVLKKIVVQEMLHMGIVANILAGLGGKPLFVNQDLHKDVVPKFPGMLKAGVHASLVAHLQPMTTKLLLDAFMVIEEPDHVPPGAGGPEFKPTGEKTIGKFYGEITWMLNKLGDATKLDPNKQIDLTNVFGSAPSQFQTVADAKKGVDIIVSQGEGAGGGPFVTGQEPAHFYQFAQLHYDGKLTEPAPGTFAYTQNEPTLKFNTLPGVPSDPPASGSVNFDRTYSQMLQDLQDNWDNGASGDLTTSVFSTMPALKVAGIALMKNKTGPSFNFIPQPAPPPGAHLLSLTRAAVPTYSQVQQALDRAINGMATIGAHGAFWRTLTRDQFVVKKVFGQQLLVVGDPANSNIVKAVRGQLPFGSDTGTVGATFRRMPAGLPAMTEPDIELIEVWIKNGCPPDVEPSETAMALSFTTGASFTPEQHNDYWRDFDNWAMYEAAPDIQDAEGVVFGLFPAWTSFAKDPTNQAAFNAAVQASNVLPALQLLSEKQKATVQRHYGTPAPLLGLLDSYQRFGAGTLPVDLKRPTDPHHQMNGASMWFVWSAFVEAAVRIKVNADFWYFLSRAILCGMLSDGLERGRFAVTGFAKGHPEDVFSFVQRVAEEDLLPELRRRYVQSGL